MSKKSKRVVEEPEQKDAAPDLLSLNRLAFWHEHRYGQPVSILLNQANWV